MKHIKSLWIAAALMSAFSCAGQGDAPSTAAGALAGDESSRFETNLPSCSEYTEPSDCLAHPPCWWHSRADRCVLRG